MHRWDMLYYAHIIYIYSYSVGRLDIEPPHLTSKHIPAVVQNPFLSLVLAHFKMSLNFGGFTSFTPESDFQG